MSTETPNSASPVSARSASESLSPTLYSLTSLASEPFLRAIAEGIPDPVAIKNEQLQYVFINPAFCTLMQRHRDDILGKRDADLFGPDLAQAASRDDQAVLVTRQALETEQQITVAPGQTRIVSVKTSCFETIDGQRLLICVGRDVTERRRTELALRYQQQILTSLLDHMPHRVWLQDLEGQYVVANQTFCQFIGLSPDELIGKTDFDFWPLEKAQIFRNEDLEVAASGQPCSLEEQIKTPDGETRWFATTKTPIYDASGHLIGMSGVSMDITDRRRAEEEVRYQQQLLKGILDNVPHQIWLKNQQGQYTVVNDALSRSIGRSPDDVIGKTDFDLWPAEVAQMLWSEDLTAMNTGKPVSIEDELTTVNGRSTWFTTIKTPIYDDAGLLMGTTGVSMDITDRHQVEEALRQAKDELEDRVAERTSTLQQTVARLRQEVSDRKKAEQALRRSEADLRQKALELQSTLQQLQKTQSQLVQSEKMSSLGQLVAGVAHEINNPVNFIYGNLAHANRYIQALLKLVQLYHAHYPSPPTPLQREIEAIDLEFLMDDLPQLLKSMKVGADRIQAIVASLRTFSRMDEAEYKAVDLHEGIDSTLLILQNRLKGQVNGQPITVIKEYGDLPWVECYAGQLNQVFMNILSNALDALDERVVSANARKVSGHGCSDLSGVTPTITIQTAKLNEDWVSIRIADNGPGIPESLQRRLFDPFFTTKPVGKGTGLGMSISYQIVTEKHNGSLACLSIPGQGAEFVIEIPIRQAIAQATT